MYKVLLIGFGHMGSSLFNSWNKSKISNISIVDPLIKTNKTKNKKIKFYKDISNVKQIDNYNIVFLAVKPQIINKVLLSMKDISIKNKLFISIIAGKNIKYFEDKLSKKISIVRTMPNLPASVGRGVTCLYANKNVSIREKKNANEMFKFVGKTFWVKGEHYIDKFTAISGSGPAYYYYFIECIVEAGKVIGLNKKLSYELAYRTAIGSIDLLKKSKDNATSLRKKIAIKGGTTEAAILALKNNKKMQKIVIKGVKSAFKRAQKIGKEKS